MTNMKKGLMLIALAVPLAACSNMTPTEQRALTGTAIGAAGGAAIGAIAGNAGLGAVIGAGAGLAGGLIVDSVRRNEDAAYNRGYSAGRSGQSARPPQ
jgi:uncharacterized protein YcfJ